MTRGGITGSLVLFTLPMTASNMMRQLYNIADTLIVGRAVGCPGMSVVLTVVSLGTRVLLAYALAGVIGEAGIWMSVPIGRALADTVGYGYYLLRRRSLLPHGDGALPQSEA